MAGHIIRTFREASFTGPPNRCAIGSEQGAVFLSRPQGGGPICILTITAGDGRDMIGEYDIRQDFGGQEVDCFAADAFVSLADPAQGGGTIKAYVNLKPPGAPSGNDRAIFLVETGIRPH